MTPEPPPPDASKALNPFDIPLRRLRLADPWRWLGSGLRDFERAPGIGLFYGSCFVLMGWALLALFEHAPVYVLALSAGFLLVGPFLCLGLYRASQQLERGGAPQLLDSLIAWRSRGGTLAIFG